MGKRKFWFSSSAYWLIPNPLYKYRLQTTEHIWEFKIIDQYDSIFFLPFCDLMFVKI